MISLNDAVLVMLEAIPYDGLMQRHQHLARELARFLPVIYCEATPSRIRRLLDGHPFDPALETYRRGPVDVGGNVRLFKAPPCVPRWAGYRRSIEGTSRRTAASLKPFLPLGRPVILWLFSPSALGSLGLYDEVLSVFDCFDAFGEFPGEERYREDVLAAMEEAARRSDLVLATSHELQARLSQYNPHTMMVQNGCDADHFISGGHDPGTEERVLDIDSIRRPIVGYMGDVAPWVDVHPLYVAAERHPEWSVVILGTWKRGRHKLHALPNVYAPGSVPYNELPFYARRFDVGTIPFELTDLTRVVNPLKLYEYFALGMPVVATDLPEVARHRDLVYIARTSDEFVALLEVGLREKPDSTMRSRRVELAKQNSWAYRAETIRAHIEELLRTREPSVRAEV